MLLDEQEARKRLVEAVRMLHARGLIAGSGGNASVRLGSDVLITPSGVYKAWIKEGDIVKISLNGDVLEGGRAPSSEWRMHTEIYRRRGDVRGVVHAHSPFTTGLTIAGKGIGAITPEAALLAPEVKTIGYVCPGTRELGIAVGENIPGKSALLLENHGVVAVGRSLEEALTVIETLEEAALTAFVAELAGGAKVIPEGEIEIIKRVYRR